MDSKSKMKVIICGFGQIGRMLLRAVAASDDVEAAGVIDIDREIVGEDAYALAGISGPVKLPVQPDIFSFEEGAADIAIVCTASSAEAVAPLILNILKKRFNIVTTCEEFSCLRVRRAELAESIDRAARQAGCAVLGTGINPGFLMDYLPSAIAVASRDVRMIRVERVQDASSRRSQFQKKIGAGLDAEAFEAARRAGTLRHVGLAESIDLIAISQGWVLDEVTESIEMVVAETGIDLPGVIPVKAGQARGVRQIGRGMRGGEAVIELVFLAALGEKESFDRVTVEGTPRLESTIAGGVNGDQGTCAVVLNSAVRMANSRRLGLLTMLDLSLRP